MQLPDFLVQDADSEIRIRGHRIRLVDVAGRYNEGHSPETIVLDHYPTLGLSLVHKIIAFYLDHEDEVNELIRRSGAELERVAALPRNTPTADELRRRMEAMRKAEAS